MPDIYVSNEKELEASLSDNHQITGIMADYVPAIFKDYDIQYCVGDIQTADSPAGFLFLKHAFHPFNYPDIINGINFPYHKLIDKILNGHELRIELSLENPRLLRLCQCLLGVAYTRSNRAQSGTDHYCSYRDKKGTLPVPYIIGQCSSGQATSIPAWSYYWDASDKMFWSGIESKLMQAIVSFKKILVSQKDEEDGWMLLNTFAGSMFGTPPLEKKRIEGPGYLDGAKWDEMLSGVVKKIKLYKSQEKGADLYETVICAFRKAFYAMPYACPEPFNVQNTGYCQMPDVTITDLTVPDDGAVDNRFGITRKFAKKLNSLQNKVLNGHFYNQIVYTTFTPPSENIYKTDGFGNLVAFKQQIGQGVIVVYPEGQKKLISKLCVVSANVTPTLSNDAEDHGSNNPVEQAKGTTADKHGEVLANISTANKSDSKNKTEDEKSPATVTIDILEVSSNDQVKIEIEITGEKKAGRIDCNKILMFLIMYHYSIAGKGIGYLGKGGRAESKLPELVGFDKDNTQIPISPKIYPIKQSTEYSQRFRRLVHEILTGKPEIGDENKDLLKSVWSPSTSKKDNYNTGYLSSLKINITAAVLNQLKRTLPKDISEEERTQLNSLFLEMTDSIITSDDASKPDTVPPQIPGEKLE